MSASKRRGPIPRRRRHDDDGEEDGSQAGDLQEYASSEGSVNTDVEEDGDISVASVDDEAQSVPSPVLEKQPHPQNVESESHFKTTVETEAMLHGLRVQDGEEVEEVNFDDPAQSEDLSVPSQTQTTSRSQSKQQLGSAGKHAAQSFQFPSRGHLLNDDRGRGSNNNGLAGPRGRGRGFAGPNTRGYVYSRHLSLHY